MRLRVRDLDAMTGFYELAIGLRVLDRDHDRVTLGAGDGAPLVELLHRPAADPRPDGDDRGCSTWRCSFRTARSSPPRSAA